MFTCCQNFKIIDFYPSFNIVFYFFQASKMKKEKQKNAPADAGKKGRCILILVRVLIFLKRVKSKHLFE